MTTIETLKAARKLIIDPSHWTQGAFGRDSAGRKRWDGFHPDCTRWCASGALEKVTGKPLPKSAMRPLQEVMDSVDIATFNDHHTHAEVLAAFDEAIAKLESK
jgi:hypothetical protein